MSVLGLSDLFSFGSHDAVGLLVALITQSCFDPGCGWESQLPLQHCPLCGWSGALFMTSGEFYMAGTFLTTGPPGNSWPACLRVCSSLSCDTQRDSSDHHHDQDTGHVHHPKNAQVLPLLVSPPTPQALAQGSVLLHYILSSAILKFLTYSE